MQVQTTAKNHAEPVNRKRAIRRTLQRFQPSLNLYMNHIASRLLSLSYLAYVGVNPRPNSPEWRKEETGKGIRRTSEVSDSELTPRFRAVATARTLGALER